MLQHAHLVTTGGEWSFAAICTNDHSADFSDLGSKCSKVRFGEPFNKQWILNSC
jgi:hypothetical protein